MTRTGKLWLACALAWTLPAAALAQNPTPARTPVASTPAQDEAIKAGVALHDQGKFDEAIARYQAVLEENPDNITAQFEMAFSYLAKKDFTKSLELAKAGATYDSDLRPEFYDLVAAALDSSGQSDQAIDTYKQAIAIAPDAGFLYYNMAVTYLESLKNEPDARRTLERGVTADPTTASTHLLLGQLFQKGGYQTPALLALSTYLIYEPASARSLQGYGLWRIVLRGGLGMTGDMMPGPGAVAPSKTDEGDFADVDAQLAPSYQALVAAQGQGTDEIRALVAQMDRILAAVQASAAKGGTPSFVSAHYVPYFVELKRRDLVEPFVYWVCQNAPITGVRDWLVANPDRVKAFVEWTRAYQWK
jgi:tetratricopeptide (TPR) repeat protein